jgi:hypothetical protein
VRGGCYTQRRFDGSRVPFTIFLLITVLRQPRQQEFLVAFEGYARWAEVCVLGLESQKRLSEPILSKAVVCGCFDPQL